ncbi:hypothetical protein EHJ13_17855 [Cronobacter dublinensis]|uniref:VENN motif-containing domain-containing protein n=1 Tax=Cronobacter dublinensis TaxID=413497 RepID=A0A9Q4T8E7_9ENTR|nr:VENN motif pre-toxin domain-containing protein [Cronobacter dublinensis]ELY9424444.1 VENN motif pre-toxin domain-containing protein [Cronobacter dublinensis]EMA8657004.1 VENN motif pre-toxin domain-containing protein [Cronobacter dublinensis]NCH89281.1 hypothetical protein [Cronobacter dublinensis]
MAMLSSELVGGLAGDNTASAVYAAQAGRMVKLKKFFLRKKLGEST